MSHTTTLKGVDIRDEAAIRQAVAKLQAKGVKCRLDQDAKPRMYFTEQGPTCEYVLRLEEGQYDVGLQRQKDGTFAPVFDEYARHVGNQVGADVAVCPMPKTKEGLAQHQIGQFMQAYAECAATNAALAEGYFIEGTTTDARGNIHLTIAGM